ncbi:GAF domain-containing protein [Cognatilysobacter bugurensis]|uniref:GAF domain-containing protein n=1 Tax=Cognatilysobacter bugurensis TaxID=543356 RepID=A0A918W6W5_9GAMM|nr:GAF domain-containing protein [Lysobacter bugurensis]GHA72313.1 hypothetical protein GCM10007067_06000 [Lysobacter bugurensis]
MQSRSTVERDVAVVQRIEAVPRILSAVTEITGMRFAAVARVTETRWTACSVRDELDFGLAPGGDLELEMTICNEIRQHREPVIFGEASTHPVYSTHHTPRHYGLQSYAAVPIHRANGDFFGTLCAIDSRSVPLDAPALLKSLELFADLIGTQLEMIEDLERARSHLHEARSRERVLATAEREIRDLLQPVVTTLYLLQGSASLSAADRRLVEDMDASCKEVTQVLRDRLDAALTG